MRTLDGISMTAALIFAIFAIASACGGTPKQGAEPPTGGDEFNTPCGEAYPDPEEAKIDAGPRPASWDPDPLCAGGGPVD